MKKLILFMGIILISLCLYSQNQGKNPGNYQLTGVRHGVSFFPQVKHKNVQYDAGENLTFEVYHSLEVVNAWMKKMG